MNNSYHNECILRDTIGETVESVEAHRVEIDECGNITAIDGKKVKGGNCVYWLAGEKPNFINLSA